MSPSRTLFAGAPLLPNLLEIRDVSFRYPGGGSVLENVNFSLARGEMVFLTGASGAGKSTLLRLLTLQLRPTRGQVLLENRDLAAISSSDTAKYRQRLGLIFQDFGLLPDRSVHDNVAMPLIIRGVPAAERPRRVRAALDAVALGYRENALPLTLSAGEYQRACIARAIVTRPLLLLADEPTGNLDPEMAAEVMKLFVRFNEAGVSVLLATHSLDLIKDFDRHIVHLQSRKPGVPTDASRPVTAVARELT
jgi:cell division transport system ATP-binding protein